MNEKLQKALKSSKQGVWIILVLAVALNAFVLVNSQSILDYAKEYWVSLIFMSSLITGLVLYGKGKYRQGAEVVQWAALGNLIVQFSQMITIFVITKVWSATFVTFLLGAIIPLILIVEALKVIRLTEEQTGSKVIPIIAIAIIVLSIIGQVIVANNQYNKIKDEFTDLNFEQVFDAVMLELGYKDDLESLPELTEEEKTKYEKEWNDFVVENRDSYVREIKIKYPFLSDEQVQDYVTQVFEFIEEYGPRLIKYNQDIIDKAQNAVNNADLAKAMSDCSLAYAEAMAKNKILTLEDYINVLKSNGHDVEKFNITVKNGKCSIELKTDSNEDTSKEDDKEEEITQKPGTQSKDPYANYKNTVWSDKESRDTKIENNKIYFLDKEVKVNIPEKIKSVETIINERKSEIYVLTEDGSVWYILLNNGLDSVIAEKKEILTNKKILDMTEKDIRTEEYATTTMFFLTEDGQLINKEGTDIKNVKEYGISYKDYEKLNWSSHYASSPRTSAAIRISNDKVYVIYEQMATQVTGISGKPIKVSYTQAAMIWFEILTDEGKVYSVIDWGTEAELVTNLTNYNIVDMTTYDSEKGENKQIYLTKDGQLIDTYGKIVVE